VHGNQTIPKTAIVSILGIEEGDLYHPDTLAAGLARLKATGDYNRIRPSVEILTDSSVGSG
jgi:outer membrane protein assembly factor BamA